MKRTRVKVCGMTCEDNVAQVVALGVDAVGVILHATSPRIIDVAQAKLIRKHIPPFVTMVGVFVDANSELVNKYINEIGLDLIQLHGNESPEMASQLTRPYVKAIRAKSLSQVERDIQKHESASAILLDPYVKGQHGGTGKQLDTSLWPAVCEKPLILAGGLNPENINTLVNELSPYAIDLNSGVEESPGIKNISLIEQAIMSYS